MVKQFARMVEAGQQGQARARRQVDGVTPGRRDRTAIDGHQLEAATMQVEGMNATVVDVDKSAFKERVKPLYDEFKAKDAQSAKNLEQVESM